MDYHGCHFDVCSHNQKSRDWSSLCAGCDKKGTGCTRAFVADTFDLSKSVMVSMGLSKLGRIDRIFIDAEYAPVPHTTVKFWLRSYCPSCLRSVTKASSARKTMRQSTFWNKRWLRSFNQTFSHPTTQIWTRLTKNMERNTEAGLGSSWCR